jgi:general secretion pathway protein K
MRWVRDGVGARREAGVALLMAMLVVAIASVTAVSLVREQSFSVRKTANIEHYNRALSFALGLEDFARLFLLKDARDSETDDLNEDWAIGIPGLPIDGGFLIGSISDAQSKININRLLNDEPTREQLRRLCQNLEIEPVFITAIVDWIDDNFEPEIPDGAEDDYYTALEQPYRVANRPMVDISELRLVKGITAEIYYQLEPFLTALPETTSFNLNTVPLEVFESLGLDVDGEAFIEVREDEPFASVEDFSRRMDVELDQEQTARLAVATAYFEVSGVVTLGEKSVGLTSLVHRVSREQTRVLWRNLGSGL